MPILQSVEAFFAKLLGEAEAVTENPAIAPFVPLAEKELVALAEDFASAHGVDPMATQKLIEDALAVATKHAPVVVTAPVAPSPDSTPTEKPATTETTQ